MIEKIRQKKHIYRVPCLDRQIGWKPTPSYLARLTQASCALERRHFTLYLPMCSFTMQHDKSYILKSNNIHIYMYVLHVLCCRLTSLAPDWILFNIKNERNSAFLALHALDLTFTRIYFLKKKYILMRLWSGLVRESTDHLSVGQMFKPQSDRQTCFVMIELQCR